jgi:hypothetical protein
MMLVVQSRGCKDSSSSRALCASRSRQLLGTSCTTPYCTQTGNAAGWAAAGQQQQQQQRAVLLAALLLLLLLLLVL